jgi:hypothetical protein
MLQSFTSDLWRSFMPSSLATPPERRTNLQWKWGRPTLLLTVASTSAPLNTQADADSAGLPAAFVARSPSQSWNDDSLRDHRQMRAGDDEDDEDQDDDDGDSDDEDDDDGDDGDDDDDNGDDDDEDDDNGDDDDDDDGDDDDEGDDEDEDK